MELRDVAAAPETDNRLVDTALLTPNNEAPDDASGPVASACCMEAANNKIKRAHPQAMHHRIQMQPLGERPNAT
jgi:hypothetical protein